MSTVAGTTIRNARLQKIAGRVFDARCEAAVRNNTAIRMKPHLILHCHGHYGNWWWVEAIANKGWRPLGVPSSGRAIREASEEFA